jgi:hypothetical protein
VCVCVCVCVQYGASVVFMGVCVCMVICVFYMFVLFATVHTLNPTFNMQYHKGGVARSLSGDIYMHNTCIQG